MGDNGYLHWMASQTETKWCNDSAIQSDIENALAGGAVGCTSNPPLTYQALTETPELFRDEVEALPKELTGDDRVVELMGIVVRHIAGLVRPVYEETRGAHGYIRTQVQPGLSGDADAMLAMGKTLASWGENVMVKIPGTKAGISVLEELAALGIPTNPTVCVSVAQMIAAAEAYERGAKRAREAGLQPAPSTAAFVMGRLQDFLAVLNDERNSGLAKYDLDCATLAATKRCFSVFQERGYRQQLMPAAFRSPHQVAGLSGADVVMTIHPGYQAAVLEAEAAGEIVREPAFDKPVDALAVRRVYEALPEFAQAYEPDGLTIQEFDAFGATTMTLEGFDVTGWQKLRTL